MTTTSLSFGYDPVLQLDELDAADATLEIEPARQRIVQLKVFALRKEVGELVVFKLELDVLVEVVLDLCVDALPELADRSLFIRAQFIRAHGRLPVVGDRAKTKRRRSATFQRWLRQFCDRADARGAIRPLTSTSKRHSSGCWSPWGIAPARPYLPKSLDLSTSGRKGPRIIARAALVGATVVHVGALVGKVAEGARAPST